MYFIKYTNYKQNLKGQCHQRLGTNNSAWARYEQTIKQFKTFIIFPKIFTKYVSYI